MSNTDDFYRVADLLPRAIAEMVDVIGMDATIRLVEELGGADFDMPVGSKDSYRLSVLKNILAEAEVDALLAVYGGARIYIPRCEAALRELRNQRFAVHVRVLMEQEGLSQKAAVQKLIAGYGITERWAYEILKGREDLQLTLL